VARDSLKKIGSKSCTADQFSCCNGRACAVERDGRIVPQYSYYCKERADVFLLPLLPSPFLPSPPLSSHPSLTGPSLDSRDGGWWNTWWVGCGASLAPIVQIHGRDNLTRAVQWWRDKTLVRRARWRASMVRGRQDSGKGRRDRWLPSVMREKGLRRVPSWWGGGKKISSLPVHLSHIGFFVLGDPRVSPPRLPNLGWIERVCGRKKVPDSGWTGTTSGDCRSFALVVRVKLALTVMVPPRLNRGWGRSGFGAGPDRGEGRIGS
jgi:hypothetical protein